MHAHVTPLCAYVHMCPGAKGKSFLSCCLCLCPWKTYKVVLPLPSALAILKLEHWVMFGHRTWRKHETTGKSKGEKTGRSRRTELQGKVDWIRAIWPQGKKPGVRKVMISQKLVKGEENGLLSVLVWSGTQSHELKLPKKSIQIRCELSPCSCKDNECWNWLLGQSYHQRL